MKGHHMFPMITRTERDTLSATLSEIETTIASVTGEMSNGNPPNPERLTAASLMLIAKALTVIARAMTGTVPAELETVNGEIHGPAGMGPS